MKDIINLLPDSIANQIAAGEVIQRPASVVKELVENSIDAGATMINVLVVDAGRTSIQVIDNGKGMSSSDAKMCFERHATSKIEKVDDLFALTTMGFRGEALASIAAIAQVELKTRTQEDELGTSVLISGSKITSQELVACPKGSNFRVSNIFYNVPARRKFLKSNTTELNNILTAFERIVLVYPNINFTFSSNGIETLNLKASNIRQRIVDVLGKKINQDILPIDVDTTICKISGFVGKPEAARKKCPHQYFFVNGRYMRHPYFHKAIAMAFERLVPQGEQVPYFIYIQVDPKNIDVNIHPTKTEIKFEDEQVVWQILNAAVKNAIGKFGNLEEIDFDSEDKIDIPVFDPLNKSVPRPSIGINPQYDPFKATSFKNVNQMAIPQKNSSSWESLYKGLEKSSNTEHQPPLNSLFDEEEEVVSSQEVIEEKSPTHYQYKGKY
ncbi:MAG: DNA mismatch repair endonuclease MutL, partial [Prevotella sp.]|nr:DNA mismatch repair endonuclease MutL [Prevotella sp.]